MTNVLEQHKQQEVLALGRLGWTLRRIAQATGVHRVTVGEYLRAAGIAVRRRGRPGEGPPKPTISGKVSTDSTAAKLTPTREVSTDVGPALDDGPEALCAGGLGQGAARIGDGDEVERRRVRAHGGVEGIRLGGGARLAADAEDRPPRLRPLAEAAHRVRMRRIEDFEIYRLFSMMVFIITGINVMTFGAFCNQVLTILHPSHPTKRSAWGWFLLHERVVQWSGWIGGAFVLAAILLNHETIRQYVLTGRIYAHWSYILTGATLFLTGSQLIMSRFLIKVLEELRERQLRVGQFLGESRDESS